MPEAVVDYTQKVAEWSRANGFEYRMHRNEIFSDPAIGSDLILPQMLAARCDWSAITNRLRLLLTFNFGGWWIDTDCKIVGDFAGLHEAVCNADVVLTLDKPKAGTAYVGDVFVMGGSAGSRLVRKVLRVTWQNWKARTGIVIPRGNIVARDLLDFSRGTECLVLPPSVVSGRGISGSVRVITHWDHCARSWKNQYGRLALTSSKHE
jgi:hypothetical protein